jgi:RpiR family transcriptional regulator, carbohydrate utilization regulator
MENNNGEISDALARIRGFAQSLSPSEMKMATYVEENYKDVVKMTLSEVATNAGVSDATAVRFCRAIGYRRWLDFILALSRSMPVSSDLIIEKITKSDTPGIIAEKVMDGAIEAIRATREVMDHDSMQAAIDLIENAQNVFIVGVGTSGPMTHELYNRLFRLGIRCQVQTDSYLQVMQSVLLTDKDVLFVISQTGISMDPIRTAALAKSKGCKVICLTGSRTTELAELADIILLSVSHDPMAETVSSRIAQYSIIHSIYINLSLRCMDKCVKNERDIWEALTSHGGEFLSTKKIKY